MSGESESSDSDGSKIITSDEEEEFLEEITSTEIEMRGENVQHHTCRICLESDDDVLSVCKCSGTSKWVHKECIVKWITTRGNKKCEICHGDFDFSQIDFDFSQIDVLDMGIDEEGTDRPCPVSNLALWLSGVLSVSQSVAS